jgi:hypothetical protein
MKRTARQAAQMTALRLIAIIPLLADRLPY